MTTSAPSPAALPMSASHRALEVERERRRRAEWERTATDRQRAEHWEAFYLDQKIDERRGA